MVEQQSKPKPPAARNQVERLHRIQQMTVQMALAPETTALLDIIATSTRELVECKRVMLLIAGDDGSRLGFLHVDPPLDDAKRHSLVDMQIDLDTSSDDPVLQQWLDGTPVSATRDQLPAASPLRKIMSTVDPNRFWGAPMQVQDQLIGLIVLELTPTQSISPLDQEVLEAFAENSAVNLYNKRLHVQTVEQLADRMREIEMLAQLDHELNESIALPIVFTLALDWALRFTNANCASIALYDQTTETMRSMLNYGYLVSDDELDVLQGRSGTPAMQNAARLKQIQVIPDLSKVEQPGWIAEGLQSRMAIPVIREERVLAVITLESRKVDAFTDGHVAFMKQLANRAAVAIENAYLYDETVRDHEKLAHIVGNIGDAVIVVDTDDRIVLIGQSALSALQLYPDKDYAGQPVAEAISFSPLLDIYRHAMQSGEIQDTDLTLLNGRDYYTRAIPDENVGCVIVMQDITPYKETDRLKNELIATVSHDLKQPLGVMHGYLDLLQMKNAFDETSTTYVERIGNAINNMRKLIDDLLDLAHLESGVDLDLVPVPVTPVVRWCIDSNRPEAEKKAMNLAGEFPENKLMVQGEQSRLQQIFNNLISNAIKYTPPEGLVKVKVEERGNTVRVTIQDNGLGIGPEDQPHIFDRFYRVRRPETDSIEGTGLGLAIVKTLVEAHHGKIRLESKLGEGSSFLVTLPAYKS